MKKIALFATAALAMVAVACGGSNEEKYAEAAKAATEKVNAAKTCEDLQKAVKEAEEATKDLKLTKEDSDAINKNADVKAFTEAFNKKAAELGC